MKGLMLIVDDTEVNREILKVLFHTDYEIMTAETGEEALSILEACQGSIDIVLMDLIMPGLSGFDMLKKRQDLAFFKDVPVVVITSSNQMEDQVQAFQMGANDFIQKPFVPEIVVSRVNNVMASNRRLMSIELEAQKLRVKSEIDEMTGIYNKATMELMVSEQLKRGSGQLDALLMIDVDNFKAVNDISGHQAGDHVLKIISNLISSKFRKSDYVGRIGGDEFCVLMVDVPSMDIVYAKVNELIQTMRYKPNLTIPEYVTLSIGLATNGRSQSSYPELFKKADAALYEAKTGGKAQYREYGVEPLSLLNDRRPVVVLLSNNRSVCSTVHALIPPQVRIVEALRPEDLESIPAADRERTAFLYADVSQMEGDTAPFWEACKALGWIGPERTFAICAEGNVAQYMAALQNGVLDLFMAPIDADAFKRRSVRYLQNAGILESDL